MVYVYGSVTGMLYKSLVIIERTEYYKLQHMVCTNPIVYTIHVITCTNAFDITIQTIYGEGKKVNKPLLHGRN